MYSFRKSKKGFTLIELMVVVAIIGVLVLLGLRAYSSQKERAANSIVKANASTIQTMLVGYMGDHDIEDTAGIQAALNGVVPETGTPLESMVNPYLDSKGVYHVDAGGSSNFDATNADLYGQVSINLVSTNNILLNARGKQGELIFTFPHSLPAMKY